MRIFNLKYSSESWGTISYIKHQRGAYHIPFPEEDDIYRYLYNVEEVDLPEVICFGADYNIIPEIDYPVNSLLIKIFSKKYLNVLTALGHFNYRTIPVVPVAQVLLKIHKISNLLYARI